MDRIRRLLAHLRSTFHPIRPLLVGAVGLLRGDARALLLALVASILVLTAMKEATNSWVEHSIVQTYRTPLDLQQWDVFCKSWREHSAASKSAEMFESDQVMRVLCLQPFFKRINQTILYVSVGHAVNFSAAAAVAIFLYLWTSARMTSRSTASPGRKVSMMQRNAVYAGLIAAAILLAPSLAFHIVKIARGLFSGAWMASPSYSGPDAILRNSLSAVWFLIAAPFVLPAVPLALISSGDSKDTRVVHLARNYYLQFAALAAAAAGPFIAMALLANSSIRTPVVLFLYNTLHLDLFSRIVFEMLLTTLTLMAVIATAAAFVVAVGPRARDAR